MRPFLFLVALSLGSITQACSDQPVERPAVNFSEGPVVTMASTTQIGYINDALKDGLSVSKGYAVRSESHEFAHYIMAPIRSSDTIVGNGLWFMYDGMDIPGDRYSVNDVARNNTTFAVFDEIGDVDPESIEEVGVLAHLVRSIPIRHFFTDLKN